MIKQGLLGKTGKIEMGNCVVNAQYNRMQLLEKHLDKVKDSDPKNVKICVGSMGFKSDNGKIHWEYGDPLRTSAEGWDNLGGIDAHAWLTYIDNEDNEIIVDPWFRAYGKICDLWNVRAKDKKNCRTYFQIQDEGAHYVVYNAMIMLAMIKNKVPKELSDWLRESRLGEE